MDDIEFMQQQANLPVPFQLILYLTHANVDLIGMPNNHLISNDESNFQS